MLVEKSTYVNEADTSQIAVAQHITTGKASWQLMSTLVDIYDR